MIAKLNTHLGNIVSTETVWRDFQRANIWTSIAKPFRTDPKLSCEKEIILKSYNLYYR